MQGEPADVDSAAEAQSWISAYTTLVAFERGILASVKERMLGLSEEYRDAVQRSNVEPLEELIRDFERRLAKWEKRAPELSGPADPDTVTAD